MVSPFSRKTALQSCCAGVQEIPSVAKQPERPSADQHAQDCDCLPAVVHKEFRRAWVRARFPFADDDQFGKALLAFVFGSIVDGVRGHTGDDSEVKCEVGVK